jgi:hypothetical protein
MLRDLLSADAGLSKVKDHVHFLHAVGNGPIIVTKNPADFQDLHEQHEPNHLVIHQDNDAAGDMADAEMVAAINYLEHVYAGQGMPVAGSFIPFNEWRAPRAELARQDRARRERRQAEGSQLGAAAAPRPRGKRK